MLPEVTTRHSAAADWPDLRAIYASAFTDEDLIPVIEELLADKAFAVCSLVAVSRERVVGHIAMTPCGVGEIADAAALLGPLGVHPDAQRQGVGSALVRAGCDAMKARGVSQVLVLGDPAYYGRFGFRADRAVSPPCPIPDGWQDAWQSLEIGPGEFKAEGALHVPPPWRDPKLWAS